MFEILANVVVRCNETQYVQKSDSISLLDEICSNSYGPVRFSYNPSFLARTVFFSHNKSAGTVFRLIFSTKRTGPISINIVKFKID